MGDVIRNFKLYNASAGSGKTFTLIKEFFVLSLSSNNLSYKNILAVTFTNKAASELKTKILDYLDGIVNNDDKAKGMKDAVIKELKIEENEELNTDCAKVVALLEKEFKKILSPLDLELVHKWIYEDKFSYSKIYNAILETLKLKKSSIQYVDVILNKKENVNT